MICVLRCARHLNTVLKAAGPEGGRGQLQNCETVTGAKLCSRLHL